MSPKLTVFALIAFLIPFVIAAHFGKRHHEVAHRARGDAVIHRRQSYGSRFTFYDVGLGACGQTNVANDFVVALNIAQFGDGYPGPNCFKSITIQYGGKTAQALIVDRCVACPSSGGLDFSRGLFDFFADESVGVIYGVWWFNGGSSNGGGGGETTTSSTWTPPTTTSTWEQPTTTTSTPAYTPPTTSSTPAYTPSSTSGTPFTTTSIASTTSIQSSSPSSPTSSTSSTSSTNYNKSSISGLVVPTGGVESPPSVTNPQNLFVINNVSVEIGIMLTAARKL